MQPSSARRKQTVACVWLRKGSWHRGESACYSRVARSTSTLRPSRQPTGLSRLGCVELQCTCSALQLLTLPPYDLTRRGWSGWLPKLAKSQGGRVLIREFQLYTRNGVALAALPTLKHPQAIPKREVFLSLTPRLHRPPPVWVYRIRLQTELHYHPCCPPCSRRAASASVPCARRTS